MITSLTKAKNVGARRAVPLLDKIVEAALIGKKYPLFKDFWALKDVSFNVSQGKILGIIGRNGAGKTTLLSIIAGVLSPTKGRVVSKGRVLGLFNLGAGF